MSAKTAMRLIARIADERARRAKTPRRGVASYNPNTPPPETGSQQGSPAEMATTSITPPLDMMIGGYTPRPVSATVVHNWPAEETEIGVRLGAPQPQKQSPAESISELAASIFMNGGVTTTSNNMES